MKRIFDILVSGIGLICLSPLLLIVAIWIKLDSPGPVFYRQVRVGRYNKDFRIFKFRSMRIGSDKGDMSLVGPRPEVRHYVNYWTPQQMHVLDVRPGITDPASIKYRNENELLAQAEDPEKYYIEVIMQEKIKLYLDYAENSSFWYDIKLIFQTFWVIIAE